MTPVASVLAVLQEALDLLTSTESDFPCPIMEPGFCRTGIYLGGEVPWDSCGESCSKDQSGMLWAKLLNITPKNTGSDSTNCQMYNWTAEIGVVRCVTGMGNDGSPPSMAAIEADAAQQVADADAIFQTLRCCEARSEALRDVTVSGWGPLGPQGDCAGGAWTIGGTLSVCC